MNNTQGYAEKYKEFFNFKGWLRFFVLLVIVAVLTSINRNFLGSYNVKTLLEDIGLLLIISCGTTFVLLIGSMDLSIGAVISCTSVILATLIPRLGVMSYVFALAFGMAAGFINGVIFTGIKIPSFITTLGTMSIYNSLALVISNATPLQVSAKYKKIISWTTLKFGIMPLVTIIALAIVFVFFIVQTKTRYGKYVFAIGANETAARMAGIKIAKNKIIVFMLAGLCFAIAGIVLTGKLKSGIPTVGNMYTLMSIAAVAFGGTSLSGGKGGILHTLLGTALIIAITNGMIVIGIDAYWQQIVYGLIIIISLCTTADGKNRNLVVK